MQTVESLLDLRNAVHTWKQAGESVALVPTLGNLHEAHLQLVDFARTRADRVVVSIFVNPLQFGLGEDFNSYPRTETEDARLLATRETDLLYLPGVAVMYPRDAQSMTRVVVPGLSDRYCGESRPGHFEGVATVVCKLLNQVQPDIGVFGKKDYQQLLVIERLVADLDMPVKIAGVETVREHDGLAMSSRNRYLDDQQRSQATGLSKMLGTLAQSCKKGHQDYRALESEGIKILEQAGFRPDYVVICRKNDLEPATGNDHDLVILGAGYLGKARLIDNISVTVGIPA
ncbi:MAG TPA: pantoate--beta-alanine ligase [Gammaproteobacteria bacterium]|nr:pantoate--beta-alanine ligase [Gammaproteobacteria bacterium]